MNFTYFHGEKLSHMSMSDFFDEVRINRDALKKLREINVIKDRFSLLMTAYGITDKKRKMISKLKPDPLYGWMSEYLVKCCRTAGVPKLMINKYRVYKRRATNKKVSHWRTKETIIKQNEELHELTIFLLNICLDEFSKQKVRNNKIESLLME